MKPREYQYDAVASLFEYWRHATGNPVVVMPTGTGKSVVIAEFNRQALEAWPLTNILVLTHVKELVEQNFLKQLEIWPAAPAGIYSSGLRRKDVGRQITFAGIGSVANVPHLFKPDVILIDEGQSVSPNEETQYRKFINAILAVNPDCKIGTLTATPFRLGQGMIVEPGGLFSDICINMAEKHSFNWFISEGYLAPLIPRPIKTELDISQVDIAPTGDYNLKQLQAAVDKEAITRAAVEEIIAYGQDRRHWLIFAAGVQHANHIAKFLAEKGIAVAVVHSNTKEFPMNDAQRDAAIDSFTSGQVRAIVNNGVLTTGFDFPGIDLIACLRHTTSPGLWVQMLGRGTRPLWPSADRSNWHIWGGWAGRFDLSTKEGRLDCIASGKPDCLVLDFAHNAARLGPVNDPIKPRAKRKRGEDEAPGDCPAKTCPACWTYNHASARVCSECGEEFKFNVKIEAASASDQLIAKAQEEPLWEWFEVKGVTYTKFKAWNARKSLGYAPNSLKVGYFCEKPFPRTFFETVNLEHDGNFLASARQWWTETSKGLTIPQTVDEAIALAHTLREPKKIRVWINRPNPKVLFREFSP